MKTKQADTNHQLRYINFSLRIFIFTLSILITGACSSPKNLIKQGNYDKAIAILVKKLHNNPDKTKNIQALEYAYLHAKINNTDRINFLKKSGQPQIWYEITQLYSRLKLRDKIISASPSSVMQKLKFNKTNYDTEIIESQKKAAAYLYAHAQQLLESNNQHDARKAYSDLMKITMLIPDYKDINLLLRQSIAQGTDYVLFEIYNKSTTILTPRLNNQLYSINLNKLERQFLSYDIKAKPNRIYTSLIQLIIDEIEITPEQINQTQFTESKTIQDGFIVLRNANNEIIYDSTSKAIEVPNMIEIHCNLSEITQHKQVIIRGTLKYIDKLNQKVLYSCNIETTSVFQNKALIANGNPEACSQATLDRLDGKILPFPKDNSLIYTAGTKFKEKARRLIWDQKFFNKRQK